LEALCCLTSCMLVFLATIPVTWFVFMRPRHGKAARHKALQDALGESWTSIKPGVFHGVLHEVRMQVSLTVQARHGGGYGQAVRLEAAVDRPSLAGSWYTPRRQTEPSKGFDAVFSGDEPPATLSDADRAGLMELYDHRDAYVSLERVSARPLGAHAHLAVVLGTSALDEATLMPQLVRLADVASRLGEPSVATTDGTEA
jgi:sulfur relay (sulfurtransferase) DsrF/TusC family protein